MKKPLEKKRNNNPRKLRGIVVNTGVYPEAHSLLVAFTFHPWTRHLVSRNDKLQTISLHYVGYKKFKDIPGCDLDAVYRLLASRGDGYYPCLPINGDKVIFKDCGKNKVLRKIRRPRGY